MVKKVDVNVKYRKCKKRILKNEFGENMCGAIACCEIGDMPCQCEVCDKCEKPYDLHCFNVHCIDGFGGAYDVGVMAYDVDSAMRSAEYSLKEGRHVVAVAEWCKGVDAI